MRSDLDNRAYYLVFFEALHILVLLLTSNENVHVEVFVTLRDHEIKDWNDISWVVNNLAVQALIKLEDVIAINFKYVLVESTNFLQLLHVVALLDVLFFVFLLVIILFYLFKVVDEIFEFRLNVTSVDVSSPDDLSGRTRLISIKVVDDSSRGGVILIVDNGLIASWVE